MGSAIPPPVSRVRPLPLSGLLRLGRPSEIWFKPALSVVVAAAPPNLTLVALGRLDLAAYAMAGSLCVLYAHNRPYAARARTLVRVVLGMLAGLTVALVAASLTTDAVVLVTVGAVLAAFHKALCDATRIGPPGNVIFTFVSSGSLFAPQTLGQVPGHVALAAAAGAWSWIVGMAPGLIRPHGPERRATAHALRSAAAFAGTGQAAARAGAAAAVHTARKTLRSTGPRSEHRDALERLVIRAEAALAAPDGADPARLRAWAGVLRGTGPVPRPGDLAGADGDLPGAATGCDGPPLPSLHHRLGPLAPLALRTALGCALAGYASLALGVGRPYWALVTAACLHQANVTLTWSRGVQRVTGNLAGVLLFAAITPLAHLGPLALVLCGLALNFGAEALISRNYWLGSVLVTPMALIITEFARYQQAGGLMADRVLDTLIGAGAGLAAAVAVTNRRAGDRVEHALTAVERAREHAAEVLTAEHRPAGAVVAARRHLVAAVVDLRAAADTAAGEWWQRALPAEGVLRAEEAGHRTLAATVRRQRPHMSEGTRV
ncbi:FUSC family protein [Streptomyces caeni]|uniref:FUSC family protein n=1 Tax=Streptomyces caeni TaxID=2307231 RepID=A0ABW4IK84_9ACTN